MTEVFLFVFSVKNLNSRIPAHNTGVLLGTLKEKGHTGQSPDYREGM